MTLRPVIVQPAGTLDSIAIPEALARDIADNLGKTQKDSRAESRREAARLERELDALEAKEDTLYEDFRTGFMDEAAYKRRLERLRTEKRRAEEALARTRNGNNADELITAKRILELASRAKSLWKSRNAYEKRQLLEKLLSNPQWDGASARYDLKKPFAVLAEMNGDGEWRARVEEFRTAVREWAAWLGSWAPLEPETPQTIAGLIMPTETHSQGSI